MDSPHKTASAKIEFMSDYNKEGSVKNQKLRFWPDQKCSGKYIKNLKILDNPPSPARNVKLKVILLLDYPSTKLRTVKKLAKNTV